MGLFLSCQKGGCRRENRPYSAGFPRHCRHIRQYFPLCFRLQKEEKQKYTFGQLLTYISPLAAPLVMAALVMKQPDMGTAAIILLLPCLLYIIAGLPAIEILLGGAGIGTARTSSGAQLSVQKRQAFRALGPVL